MFHKKKDNTGASCSNESYEKSLYNIFGWRRLDHNQLLGEQFLNTLYVGKNYNNRGMILTLIYIKLFHYEIELNKIL